MNIHRSHLIVKIIVASIIVISLAVAGIATAQERGPSTEPGAVQAVQGVERTVAYDSATSKSPPPDENPRTGSVRRPNAPAATFSYYQVTGATLRGRNSDTGYVYDGVGCSHVTSGASRILNTELPLPDGSIIKYLRVYYQDTNAANGVEGYITRYQPGTATSDLVHTGSSDAFAGGYGFVVSAEITEVVDNTPYAYTLIGWPDDANINNKICGLRVAYYAPFIALTYLPTLIKQ